MSGERQSTHYVGDDCDGGHFNDLIPDPDCPGCGGKGWTTAPVGVFGTDEMVGCPLDCERPATDTERGF